MTISIIVMIGPTISIMCLKNISILIKTLFEMAPTIVLAFLLISSNNALNFSKSIGREKLM